MDPETCRNFDEEGPTGCQLGFGRRAPRDCPGCSAYDPVPSIPVPYYLDPPEEVLPGGGD